MDIFFAIAVSAFYIVMFVGPMLVLFVVMKDGYNEEKGPAIFGMLCWIIIMLFFFMSLVS